LEIPYGKTVSYGDLAKKAADVLGKPRMSAQAVGQAVGANPIAIVIPCHRVLGADGSLTGYAGGIHYKKALLQLEAPEP
jgi:O-6-methylguanine DNA methyltransferase